LDLAQEMKDKIGMMGASIWSMVVAYFNQDFEHVENLSTYCLELNKEVGVLLVDISSYKSLFLVMLRVDKWLRARENLMQYLTLVLETPGYEYDQRLFIMGMAGVAAGLDQYVNAARLLGTVEAQFESFYKPMDPWDQDMCDRISSVVHSHLKELDFNDAWCAGRELSLEQAIKEAQKITP
jgi:hypothetical protein